MSFPASPKHGSEDDRIVAMFRKCDANRSGFIEREDLATAFPDLSPRDIEDIYGHVDKNRDGVISLDEFASAYAEREILLSSSPSPSPSSLSRADSGLLISGNRHKSLAVPTTSLRDTVDSNECRMRSASDASQIVRKAASEKRFAPRAPDNIPPSPTGSDRSNAHSTAYRKSRFRNMKAAGRPPNGDINAGVWSNLEPKDEAIAEAENEMMDEELRYAQDTATRRPSLQQAGPTDQTTIEELRVIEDQKRIFTETLSEMPCESEIYRLYEIISSPAFERKSKKKAEASSTSPSVTEAKHLFEEIFYTILLDYRNKKSDLEKYSNLYKEKAKECKDLAEKLSIVSLHSLDNSHETEGDNSDEKSLRNNSGNKELERTNLTLLPAPSTRGTRSSSSAHGPQNEEEILSDPAKIRSSSTITPVIQNDRIGRRRDSFTQTSPPNCNTSNRLSQMKAKQDSNETVDYRNTKASDRIFNVILAGDTSVGKTSILVQFCQNYFDPDTHTTLGIDCHTKTVLFEGLKVTLKIWDTVGQERFRSLTKSYFRRADGIMLVYDSTQEDSLVNIRYWLETIKETANKQDISIVVCANKCDLVPRENSVVGINKTALDIANENDAAFWIMSAKTGKNIENGFMSLIRMMIEREDNELFKATAINLKTSKTNPSKKCCE